MTAPVIDTQVHTGIPSYAQIEPYLDDYLRDFNGFTGYRGPMDYPYAKGSADPAPAGWAQDGPQTMIERLNGDAASVAILTCEYPVDGLMNPYSSAVFARAVNKWQAEHWLSRDERFHGSIVVGADPELAVEEIERCSQDPRFIQIALPVRSVALAGKRVNHPVWRAAEEHGLPVALTYGGVSPNPPSAAGWHTYYAEEYVAMSITCQSQIMNIIAEGVLDRFPATRVICAGCGWSWLPGLVWRMDKNWKGIRQEIPWVKRLPSEYIAEHFRFTLAPLEVGDPQQLLQTIEWLESNSFVMYSSDYPYRPSVASADELLAKLDSDLVQKIATENAASHYGAGRLGVGSIEIKEKVR